MSDEGDGLEAHENFYVPFCDKEVRQAWLDVLEYLEDDELIPYEGWLASAKDMAFDTLVEEGLGSEYAQEYIVWVGRLRSEQMYLMRRKNANA